MNLLDYQTPFLHEVFIVLRVAVSKIFENAVSSKESAAMLFLMPRLLSTFQSLATKQSSFAYSSYESHSTSVSEVFTSDNLEKMMSREHPSLRCCELKLKRKYDK